MSNRIRLQIGPHIYPFWTNATVSKRIDAISSAFTLELIGTRAKELTQYGINAGDKVGLFLEEQAVLSGYIDAIDISLSKTGYEFRISGRDNSADLVDCSALPDRDEFREQSLYQIALQLCNPLGVPVLPEVDSSPISSFKVDPGETVFEALERAGRLKGLFFRPDGLGNISIARVGQVTAKTSLKEGENILSASATYDHSNRFSDYIVKSQHDEEGSIESSSKDDQVRFRPKLILAPLSVSSSEAAELAQWEKTVRTARSVNVSIETQGWTTDDGKLWDVNQLIKVQSPSLGIDAYMFSTGIDFTFDIDQGTKTSIELSRYDAFTPKPHSEVI